MPKPQDFVRFTAEEPKGAICHSGDCEIFSVAGICTCGLLHTLETQLNAEAIYPNFRREYLGHAEALQALTAFRRHSIVNILAWAKENNLAFADPKDKPKP